MNWEGKGKTYRDEDDVEGHPDEVELPAEVLDTGRRRLHDAVVRDPVARGGDRRALRAHRQRVDLDGVQPRHALPADACEAV